jgi:hypothetical protein
MVCEGTLHSDRRYRLATANVAHGVVIRPRVCVLIAI